MLDPPEPCWRLERDREGIAAYLYVRLRLIGVLQVPSQVTASSSSRNDDGPLLLCPMHEMRQQPSRAANAGRCDKGFAAICLVSELEFANRSWSQKRGSCARSSEAASHSHSARPLLPSWFLELLSKMNRKHSRSRCKFSCRSPDYPATNGSSANPRSYSSSS